MGDYTFDENKYRVVRDENTYKVTMYRNGEYWASGTECVVGNKLFHAMLNEIDKLRHQLGDAP